MNGDYFAASTDNAPLHALRDGLDGPNGLYAYGASAFPTQSYHSSNYWVDVVFDTALPADMTPPHVNSVTPVANASAVPVTSVVTATFSEMLSANSVTTSSVQLRDAAGTLIPASVFAGGETPTVTLTPTIALAGGTTYTATVRGGANGVRDLAGNPMGNDFTWSFTTVGGSPVISCPCSIWSDTVTPAGPDDDSNSIEVGVKFQSSTPGYITALRYYKFAENTGTHIGDLWTRTGTRLATATFTNETVSGWQQVTLSSAVAIDANTTYIASYHANGGRYAVNSQGLTSGAVHAPLRALSNTEDGGNGVYQYGPSGSFPTQTYQAENYWVDVVFTTNPPDTIAPTVTRVTPAPGAANIAANALIAATFSEAMDPATITTATMELRDSTGALVPGAVTYDAPTRVATLTPAAALGATTTYTATVKGGAADPRAKDAAGNALAANAVWTFTTAAAPRPTDGPGGPILLVTSTANPFSGYYAEILRAEGLNEFAVQDRDGGRDDADRLRPGNPRRDAADDRASVDVHDMGQRRRQPDRDAARQETDAAVRTHRFERNACRCLPSR